MAIDAIVRQIMTVGKKSPGLSYTVYAGNTVELTFLAVDENNQPLDITGWTIKYKIKLLASGVTTWQEYTPTVDGDQTSNTGRSSLLLSPIDTSGLVGSWDHILVATDAAANVGTFMTGKATYSANGA